MNKKIILTSILAISFAMPAVARRIDGDTEPTVTVQPGVGGSEQCDTATLGQSENNSTANVEAIWVPNTYYIMYHCAAGYSLSQEIGLNTNVTYGESYTFTDATGCEEPGYTFTNWSCHDKNNLNTTTYTAGQTITWNIDSNLICDEQRTANTININWKSDGVNVAQNTCTYDQTITLPQQPSKTGYTFNGWLLHDDCGDLSTSVTCKANNTCLWIADTNSCVNMYSCDGLSENDCESKSYCMTGYTLPQADGTPAQYSGCSISPDIRCAQYESSETCLDALDSSCSWNTETNKCQAYINNHILA